MLKIKKILHLYKIQLDTTQIIPFCMFTESEISEHEATSIAFAQLIAKGLSPIDVVDYRTYKINI